MGMITMPCAEPRACSDCDGPYDVSEAVKKYSLEVKDPIEVRDTKQVITAAKDIFTWVGKLQGYQYHIEMDESVCPVVDLHEKSNVPEKLKPLLRKKLNQME